MRKIFRKIRHIVCFMLLISTVAVQATTFNYWMGADGGNFSVGANWMNSSTLVYGVAPSHVGFTNEYWAIMNGGNTVVSSNADSDLLTIGDVVGATCTVNAGVNLKIWNTLALGHLGGNGVFNVNGTAYSEKLQLAQGTGSVSTINIGSGATYTVGWWGCEVGMLGTGYVNLRGTGNFTIMGNSEAASLIIGTNGHIDIEDGILAQAGNWVTKLQGYISSGKITAYSGTGVLNAPVYNSGTGWTTLTAVPGSGLTNTTWFGGTGSWIVGANWTGGVPASNKIININGGAVTLSSSTAAAYSVSINSASSTSLSITNSILTISQTLSLADMSLLEINSGNVNVSGIVKVGDAGACALIMNGGTLTVGDDLVLGCQAASTSALNMFGGNINIAGSFVVGQDGTATAGISGTVECGGVSINSFGIIDISSSGVLVIQGDVKSAIDAYIASNKIIADGGASTISVDYNVSNPGKTTIRVGYIIAYKGDLNCDNAVDFKDMSVLAEQWLQHRGNPPYAYIAPIADSEDVVNFADFAVVAEQWLEDIMP
jgi:hypothetical protein